MRSTTVEGHSAPGKTVCWLAARRRTAEAPTGEGWQVLPVTQPGRGPAANSAQSRAERVHILPTTRGRCTVPGGDKAQGGPGLDATRRLVGLKPVHRGVGRSYRSQQPSNRPSELDRHICSPHGYPCDLPRQRHRGKAKAAKRTDEDPGRPIHLGSTADHAVRPLQRPRGHAGRTHC